MRLGILVGAFLGVCMPATCFAGTYTLKPIVIAGATNIWAASINDSLVVVGSYSLPVSPYPLGFAGKLGQTTTLPPQGTYPGSPQSGIALPSSVNNAGTILGTFQISPDVLVFAYKNNTYSTLSGGLYPTEPPYVGTADHVAITVYTGNGNIQASAGTLAAQVTLGTLNTAVRSINGHSQAAGDYGVFIGKYFRNAVFFTTATHVPVHLNPILPPHAQNAYGGWINDSAMIAGSYQDKAGALHGFVLSNHVVTTFDMPVKPQLLTTQGIDESGRVVGTYSDGITRHGFVYNGKTVTDLGSFPSVDIVHVGISPFAHGIVVAHTSGTVSESWLASCTPGSGC